MIYNLEDTLLLNVLGNQKYINLLQKYIGSIVFSTSLIAASSSDFYVIKAQNIVFHPNANTLCKQETQDCQNPLLIPMFYVHSRLLNKFERASLSKHSFKRSIMSKFLLFWWNRYLIEENWDFFVGKDLSSYDQLLFSLFPS